MKIEIITIGDEILIGQIVDTNSAWMGAELTKEGFEVIGITSVGDSAANITRAIDIARERANVILLTGGVGPTNDDITKKTLCNYFHTSLIFNDEVFQQLSALFSKKGFHMNELTKNQAFVPENSIVIQNKVGTAPILWFEQNNLILISMPGVPFEMKTAMTDEIIPRLKEKFSLCSYLKKSFLVSGITESALSIMLQDFENELPTDFSLAYLPSYGMIRLRLSVRGIEHENTLQVLSRQLISILGNLLIAETEKPLEAVLGDMLLHHNYTISTAESCTGGNISHQITFISGASRYFKGSIVSYSNEVKTETLHVERALIEKQGAVSQEVVEAMAQNVADKMKTDCSIAVSGIAGPDGGTPQKPVGTVWICTKTPTSILSKKYNLGASREEIIRRSSNIAMLQLIKMLIRE